MEKRNKKKKRGRSVCRRTTIQTEFSLQIWIIIGILFVKDYLSLKNLQHPLPAKLVSTAKVNQHANASILLNKKEAFGLLLDVWGKEKQQWQVLKRQWHLDVWPFFHLDSWGCLQFKHGPRARLQRCPSPSGSLITVTWTWEVMWDSVPQITSSWIWPEGEETAGQTWLVLSAKPGINSHQLSQGEEDWPEQG